MALRSSYQQDVLTSIGVEVAFQIGSETPVVIDGCFNYGDLGADAQDLDATPLSATHAIKKAGLIDEPKWEVQYYYNEADYAAIEALKNAQSVTAKVTFPNGTVKTNTVEYSSHYVTGSQVNGMIVAKAAFVLGNANGWTHTT